MCLLFLSMGIHHATAQVSDDPPYTSDEQSATDDKYFDDDDIQPSQAPQQDYAQFYSDLTPYGTWRNNGT